MIAMMFVLPVVVSTQPVHSVFWQNITITIPANHNTWASSARNSLGSTQAVLVILPAFNVESRIILGTNLSPGASTPWRAHTASQRTTRDHVSHTSSGTSIRAQFRSQVSRTGAFTTAGAWRNG